MQPMFIFALLGAAVALVGGQKDPNWVQGRNTIVHLFEWKFTDIALECERYLGPQGYAAVQVSPVTEYVVRNTWWESYSPVSYKIISRYGNEEEFADMVRRCNNVGVRIYVDVVLRHMGGTSSNDLGIGGSYADPAQKYYPAVPYYPEDFLPDCGITGIIKPPDYRDCSMNGFNALSQRTDWVRGKQIEFLDKLVDYGVAGFRIEGAQYMWPEDLHSIFSRVKSLSVSHGFPAGSRPFIYQEVIDMTGGGPVYNYEYTGIGRVTEFRYGKELSGCFGGNNALKWLKNFGTEWRLMDSDDALAFIDNYDNQRQHAGAFVLTFKTPKEYKMAVAFMQAWPYGVTRVMSSFDFSDVDAGPPTDSLGSILDVAINDDQSCGDGWVCEHRWPQIANMVRFRRATQGTIVWNWWDNGNNQIAFCRGNAGFIAFNKENVDMNQTLQTCLPQGTYCDLISGTKSNGRCTGKSVEVSIDGSAYVQILSAEDDGVLAITRDTRL